MIITPAAFAASALRITPAYSKIIFEPYMEYESSFKIITYGNKYIRLSFDGKFSKYTESEFKDQILDLRGIKVKEIPFKIIFPSELKPGNYRIDMMAHIVPSDNPKATVGALAGVGYTVFVTVPHEGPYAEIQVKGLSKDISTGENVSIPVQINNYGGDTLNNLIVDIEITDNNGKIVASLKTEQMPSLKPKDSKIAYAQWETTGLEPGDYLVNGTLDYSDERTPARSSYVYRLGSKYIELINATGEIHGVVTKFSIEGQSKWNDRIEDVAAFMDLYDKNRSFIGSAKSASIDFTRFEERTFEGFIETNNIKEGLYDLDTHLIYEGEPSNATFEVYLKREKEPVQETPLYRLIASNALTWLLIIIIFLLIAYNIKSHLRKEEKEDIPKKRENKRKKPAKTRPKKKK